MPFKKQFELNWQLSEQSLHLVHDIAGIIHIRRSKLARIANDVRFYGICQQTAYPRLFQEPVKINLLMTK